MAHDDGNDEPLVTDSVPPEAREAGPQPEVLGDVYVINYGAALQYDASHPGRGDRMIWNRASHAPRVSHPNLILAVDAAHVTTVDGTSKRPAWVAKSNPRPISVRVEQGVAHLVDRHTYLRFDDDRFHAAVPIRLLHDRDRRYGRSKRIGHLFDDPPNPASSALAKEIVRALALTGRNISHRSLYRAWEAEARRRAADHGAEPES